MARAQCAKEDLGAKHAGFTCGGFEFDCLIPLCLVCASLTHSGPHFARRLSLPSLFLMKRTTGRWNLLPARYSNFLPSRVSRDAFSTMRFTYR